METLTSNLNQMLTSVQEVASLITSKLIEAAPKALEAILWIKRIEGIQELLTGVLLLIASLSAYKIGVRLKNTIQCKSDAAFTYTMLTIISIAITVLSFTYFLGDVWNWIAVFKPDLAIAKELVDSILTGRK